ncbi:uncharacterized protein LOC129569504 [Sitodiplosis mosellana]|uniref:uncharacterized protein LOC129569504 n=1 Tax=Sitodiplosis mosellana TaxID=263140 RepID=UPI0024443E79|nr:uncharacterized protein LOC129569504 [Sitodiplosis mosellana]
MHLSVYLVGLFAVGAFASVDIPSHRFEFQQILAGIPQQFLKRIFGNLKVISFDVEKQEVIELSAQGNYVSYINAMDKNHPSTPPPRINEDDTPQNDAPETNTQHVLDVRFDVPDDDQNIDQNNK